MNSNLRRITTLINKQKHLHVVAKTSTKRSKSQDPCMALQVHYNKMSFTSLLPFLSCPLYFISWKGVLVLHVHYCHVENERMNEWMDRWMNGWMNEWMDGWMNEWMNEWMDGWMNEWMDKWINELMNEQRTPIERFESRGQGDANLLQLIWLPRCYAKTLYMSKHWISYCC